MSFSLFFGGTTCNVPCCEEAPRLPGGAVAQVCVSHQHQGGKRGQRRVPRFVSAQLGCLARSLDVRSLRITGRSAASGCRRKGKYREAVLLRVAVHELLNGPAGVGEQTFLGA